MKMSHMVHRRTYTGALHGDYKHSIVDTANVLQTPDCQFLEGEYNLKIALNLIISILLTLNCHCCCLFHHRSGEDEPFSNFRMKVISNLQPIQIVQVKD